MHLPASYQELIESSRSREHLRTQCDHGNLIRLWHGAYGISEDEITRIQALFAVLPSYARLSGWTAASWYGLGQPKRTEISIVVPQGCPHPRFHGVEAHESVLPLPDPVWIHGVPLLPPARVAVDLARSLPRISALPVLDGALRANLFTGEALVAEADKHAGLRGIRQARELVGIADPRSECQQESQLRLIIIDGGLPAPEPQLIVGYYRIDLGYEQLCIGMEYDGQSHLTRDRLRYDRRRMNWLADQGWTIRYFTDRDIYGNPHRVVAVVRRLLR